MKAKTYWIKERYNPQLGTYWVPCGKMSKSAARKYERPLYGTNVMHGFDTQHEYEEKIAELRKCNERIHESV